MSFNEKAKYEAKVDEATIALVKKTGETIKDKKIRGEVVKPEQPEVKNPVIVKEKTIEFEKHFDFSSIYKKFWILHFRKKNTKEDFLEMFEKFFNEPHNQEKLQDTYKVIDRESKKIKEMNIKDSNHNWHKSGAIIKYVIKHDTKCAKDFWKQIVERIHDDTKILGISPDASQDIKKASFGEELTILEKAFHEAVARMFIKNFQKDIWRD